MIDRFMHITILTLWKQKKSKSEIARIVNCDRKTIRRVIKQYEKQQQDNTTCKDRPTKFDICKDEMVKLIEQDLSAVRVYEELIAKGFVIGYRTVSRYIADIKGSNKVCIRFHTAAGEEAQVDFGYAGYLPDTFNKRRKAWVFNMRLSFSRLDYYEVVFDQKVETFIHCHVNAFKYFGGVPRVVKLDNLKAAVLEAHLYETIHQSLFKQFADYYGFNILACRVRKPQEKGKTEAGIKYVKYNFFAGRKFIDHQDLVFKLNDWLNNKCNARLHGTTKRVPRELFDLEEKSKLIALPIDDFTLPNVSTRKVYNDCHITIDGNYYSVPFEYVGKTVEIELDIKLLKIIYQGKQIATHMKAIGKGNHVTNKEHYHKYKYFDLNSNEYRTKYQDKMRIIGNNALKLFTDLLKCQPYNWNRIVQGIISLQKTYTASIIDLACKRASVFGVTSYSKIRSICKTGSYALPLDELHMQEPEQEKEREKIYE